MVEEYPRDYVPGCGSSFPDKSSIGDPSPVGGGMNGSIFEPEYYWSVRGYMAPAYIAWKSFGL